MNLFLSLAGSEHCHLPGNDGLCYYRFATLLYIFLIVFILCLIFTDWIWFSIRSRSHRIGNVRSNQVWILDTGIGHSHGKNFGYLLGWILGFSGRFWLAHGRDETVSLILYIFWGFRLMQPGPVLMNNHL
ncbi:hypothetical protein BO99DRAFT_100427 [Aspergillus violaceofuscus CBS 115571]|uniref:Uncharacterized protein n=1 Tax=Aspergillus violaceofuscus (strain CBS 115571) TaxID=1450538 RepID=A0A2V5H9F3_ASPV1|nr:hypothetical protein BO99DRAFT_100427 [Aspergillus violaceofuscus CBS 115571]